MEWNDWHEEYDHSPSLQARLVLVRAQIAAALDRFPPGPVSIVSLCAGDGRDVIVALAAHPRRGDATVTLLETDPGSITRGQAAVATAGLTAQIRFVPAHAGLAASYAGFPRADLLIASGFLGHLQHQEAANLIAKLPMLIKKSGQIIWNRHLVMNDGRNQGPALRNQFSPPLFAEEYFETTAAEGFAVGRARFLGNETPLDPSITFFNFGSAGPHPTAASWRSELNPEQSIPEAFAHAALAQPGRPAIGSGDWQPTYGDLHAAATRVANHLSARAGNPGDRVALLMRPDGHLIAAILGTLIAGRVVVVLNPSDPTARLKQVFEHAGASALLADESHLSQAREIGGEQSCANITHAIAHDDTPLAPLPTVAPDALAWLIYTSGSTGTPKAVMQTHRNILHNASRNAAGTEMNPDDRVLLMALPSGGQGVGVIWATLMHGATLCPYPTIERGVEGLSEWMTQHDITVYVSAASVFRHAVKSFEKSTHFPHVRVVRLASEPVTFQDFLDFRRHFSESAILLVTLSSSEAGNITQCRLHHGETLAEGRLPVGTPSDGIEILLRDDKDQPVANGDAGQILVRSRYLSPGYWKNDTLTAQRFIAPSSTNDAPTFRTGDLARRLPDGRLLFVGRADTQVKIHGYRIELEEVEAALQSRPEVDRAVVIVRDGETTKPRLIGYVVLRPGLEATGDALRAALRQVLPGYMVPTAIVVLPSFELNAHGKIDRTRLPLPAEPAVRRIKVRRAPRDNVEKVLAVIWEEVLGLEAVGYDENFFDLGGDSLQALAIVARIEKEFGELPPLSIFLDAGTIAAQAEALSKPWAALKSTCVPLRPSGQGPTLYCVHGAGGEVFSFAALARALGDGTPVYGLQSAALLGEWPPTTLEEFARRQVQEILARDPTGPCALAGHCAGGYLALEIARQLETAGKPVQLVALIDTVRIGRNPLVRSSSPRRRITDWFSHRFRRLRWTLRMGLERLLGLPTKRFTASYRRFADHAFKDAMRRYKVPAYTGAVASFLAERPVDPNRFDLRLQLVRDCLPHARIFHIRGNHEGCLRPPHVESLAAALQEALAAEATPAPSFRE